MNILVTGGASGLGRAITQHLAANKTNTVYFTYNFSVANCQELEKQFNNAYGIKCNFSDTNEMEELLKKLSTIELDALVNNAFTGEIVKQHFHKGGTERFEQDFKNNVLPVIRITQEAINLFRKKKAGRIVTILSSAIINKPPIGWSAYTAGKSYLEALNKSWATENAAFNISCNCISPGFMQTALTADTDSRIVEEMVNTHPLKRLLTTDEVAGAVNYFLSGSLQINGTNMILNAGADMV